eukprot:6154701-Prorocentrum_lima.AAC.1
MSQQTRTTRKVLSACCALLAFAMDGLSTAARSVDCRLVLLVPRHIADTADGISPQPLQAKPGKSPQTK